jgi:23S rRNA pseudouridine1911/1915/1917 synthase
MAIDANGRAALTKVHVLRRTPSGTLLGVRLYTGRTHQIRVHLAAVGFPVVGDRLYGRGEGPLQLHASALSFVHPTSGKALAFVKLPPNDFVIEATEEELVALHS